MIHLHFICGYIAALKRAQRCLNRLSYLREIDMSLMEVGLKITFLVITPEPEVFAIIRLNLIDGTTRVFKLAQVYSNRFSHL